jgi:hypothetical protein
MRKGELEDRFKRIADEHAASFSRTPLVSVLSTHLKRDPQDLSREILESSLPYFYNHLSSAQGQAYLMAPFDELSEIVAEQGMIRIKGTGGVKNPLPTTAEGVFSEPAQLRQLLKSIIEAPEASARIWAGSKDKKTSNSVDSIDWLLDRSVPPNKLKEAIGEGIDPRSQHFIARFFDTAGLEVLSEYDHILKHARDIDYDKISQVSEKLGFEDALGVFLSLPPGDRSPEAGAEALIRSAGGSTTARSLVLLMHKMAAWRVLPLGVARNSRFSELSDVFDGGHSINDVIEVHATLGVSNLGKIVSAIENIKEAGSSPSDLAHYSRLDLSTFLRACKLVKAKVTTHAEIAERAAKKPIANVLSLFEASAAKAKSAAEANGNGATLTETLKKEGLGHHPGHDDILRELEFLKHDFKVSDIKRALSTAVYAYSLEHPSHARPGTPAWSTWASKLNNAQSLLSGVKARLAKANGKDASRIQASMRVAEILHPHLRG